MLTKNKQKKTTVVLIYRFINISEKKRLTEFSLIFLSCKCLLLNLSEEVVFETLCSLGLAFLEAVAIFFFCLRFHLNWDIHEAWMFMVQAILISPKT